MARKSPIEFLREVRQEVTKVTWPTTRETAITTLLVFIMVVIAAVFFLLMDGALSWCVRQLLSLGA